MKIRISFRKSISVIATLATIFNSLASPVAVLAQEVTPTPTDVATPTPTDQPTISPTDTASPTVTPTDIATPTSDLIATPTPIETVQPVDQSTSSPVPSQAPESNPTTQGPPSDQPTVTASATPTSTPEVPTEHGDITTTTIENVDLSQITQLNANVDGASNITTDKADYHPTDVVLITGTGFTPYKDYTIEIVSTDQPPVDFKDQLKADSTGNLNYAYQLDGIMRLNYSVYVKNGETIVAQTTFTDNISFGLAQCAQNDKQGNTPLGLGYCNWIGSSLGTSNSKLFEGMATEQQLLAEGMTGSSHTMIVGVQATKGGHHAYDWLVSDAQTSGGDHSPDSTLNSQQTSTEQGITLQLNRCSDSLSNSDKTACSNLVGGGNFVDISVPDDPFTSADGSTQSRINAYESAYGNRTVRLYSSSAITGTPTMSLVHMDGKLSGNVLANGADTGDSYIWFTITWTSSGANAMLTAAADIAMGGTGTGRSWGPGRGAGGISGAPYHFYLISVDGTGGSLDNQLSADAVTPAATSLVTTQVQNASNVDVTNTSVPTGTVVHDHATVDTGSASITIPNGSTFTFHRYSTIDCTGTPNDQTGVSVPSGAQTGSANSNTFTPGPGVYSYLVDFISGDTSKVTNSTGTCEPFTVTKLSPSIATTLSATSVGIGVNVHDSSALTGATSNAGGTVTYHAYAGANTCSGTDLLNSQVTVTNGSIPNSTDISFSSAGTYSFQAVYSGDSNNNGATSTCSSEQLVVTQGQPSIVTNATSSVVVGNNIKDTATISNLVNPDGTAKISFSLYSDNACKNLVTTSQSGFVTTNGNYDSANYLTNQTGTYYWIASYPGDSNNKSATTACGDANESSLVNPATPTLTTTATAGPVTVGGNIHDVAHLSGGYGTLSGTISFEVFAPGDTSCSTPISVSPDATVSGANDYTSGNYATSAVGTYRWIAHYTSGDSNNNDVSTSCNDANESSTVQAASPTIETTPNPAGPVVLGSTLNDSALLSGGYNPVGTILFSLYGPTNPTCSGTADFTNSVSVNGDGSYNTSSGFAALTAGVWNWIAAFTSGNTNNNNVSGTCGQESVTISKADTRITTQVLNTQDQDITNKSVPLGSIVHDSATVSGQVSTAIITGTLTYKFFDNASCTGNPVSTESGVTLGSNSTPTSALGAGSYGYLASYSGDTNYNGSTGICEPFTVNKAQLGITTIVHNNVHGDITNGTVDAGSVTHDTATVSGQVQGFDFPTPTFTLTSSYTDSCSNGAAVNNDGTDSGNGGFKSSDSAVLDAGQYAYRAVVAGNDNYLGSIGSCEPFSVGKVTPGISTTPTASPSPVLGATISDSALLTGGFNLTGSILFSLFTPLDPSCQNTAYQTSSATVNGAGTYYSSGFSAIMAGVWNWIASYSGDTNNNPVSGKCGDESITIGKADTRLSTDVKDANGDSVTNSSLSLGSVVHDTATLTGQVGNTTPTGTITYDFYSGSCTTGNLIKEDIVSLGNDSSATDALGAGNYYYLASYSGDGNYNGSSASCEPFTISKATPQVNTEVHNSSEKVIGLNGETLDFKVHDSASVSGGVNGFDPTGNVSFQFFSGTSCDTETFDDAGTVTLAGGVAHPSNTETLTQAGLYSFRAHYNGDNNYNGATSACEPFTLSTLQIVKNTVDGNDTFNFTTTDSPTDINQNVTTTNGTGQTSIIPVLSGDYSLSETPLAGWTLTGSNCGVEVSPNSFTINAGDAAVCTFNNEKNLNPALTIAKSNDKSGGASAGDTVNYSLVISNTGDTSVFGIDVQDILPAGFSYVSNSTTVNGVPFSDLGLNISGSTLKWSNVGNLDPEQNLTLSYRAAIATNVSNGIYTNFASCSASTRREQGVDCTPDPVSSTVPVGSGVSFNGSLGQVLGISTSLPGTGSPTALALIALGLIGVGFILRKKYVKN